MSTARRARPRRREHPTTAYRRWWLGKRCRLALDTGPFRRVVDLECVGPPSFVYGYVWLVYEDGARQAVRTHGFRPRKADVLVEPEPGASPENRTH